MQLTKFTIAVIRMLGVSIMDNLHMIHTHKLFHSSIQLLRLVLYNFCIWAFNNIAKEKSEPTSAKVFAYHQGTQMLWFGLVF